MVSTLAAPGPLITCDHMMRRDTGLGTAPRFVQAFSPGLPVLRGRMETHELCGGLLLHLADVEDLIDGVSENLLTPGLKLTMVLSGATELSYGGKAFHLAAAGQERAGVLISLARSDQFRRRWQAGRREIKCVLTLPAAWLARMAQQGSECWDAMQRFSAAHLSELRWLPSAAAQTALRRLFDLQGVDPLVAALQREQVAVQLAAEIVQLFSPPRACVGTSVRVHQRMLQAKDFLDSGAAEGLGLDDIARQMATNPVDLQRHFRQVWGTTVFAYLRERKLVQARIALEDGASVMMAAELAGYGSPASFATAFKRLFGVTPSSVGR